MLELTAFKENFMITNTQKYSLHGFSHVPHLVCFLINNRENISKGLLTIMPFKNSNLGLILSSLLPHFPCLYPVFYHLFPLG